MLLDMLRSNLRGSDGVPVRVVIAANPGGVGHQWLARRYALRGTPWLPFEEPDSGRQFVSCPSTHRDNPHISRDEYRQQILAGCPSDPELARAWLEGDWTVARGAFFAGVLSEQRSALEPWPLPTDSEESRRWWAMAEDRGWRFELSYDHGSAAPAVCFVVAKSPGDWGPDGHHFPADSVLLIDELHTAEPGNLTKGLQWPIPKIAEAIREMCDRWGISPSGVADDAIFAQHGSQAGSIGDEFSRCGVNFRRAGKGSRVHGWEKLRRLMSDAGKPDVPGFYVSRACTGFWQTVPTLPRDPRKPDDVDSRGLDHWCDSARYSLSDPPYLESEPLYL